MNEPKDRLSVYERFTLEGFFIVSLWAIAYTFCVVQAISIGQQFGLYQISGFWKMAAIIYGIIWILCFLFMCLIPKLKREK